MFEFADLIFDFDAKLISGEREEIINLDKFAYSGKRKENYESLETAWVRLVTLKRKEKRRKTNTYILNLVD